MTALKKKFEGANSGGFTLIELLIVIAILGVLAVVILVAINPQEQLARTRDAGRTSSVTQLGHAASAFATSRGQYPLESVTWIDNLVDAGEISTDPAAINYSLGTITSCGIHAQNGYCYVDDGDTTPQNAMVYTRLESGSNNDRCVAATPEAYIVWDTVSGRGGIVCMATGSEPSYTTDGQTFIN